MKSSSASPTAGLDLTARIFNVQRFSTEDGPGIRTTVFMKGCPLLCPWCHNPESLRNEFELIWHPVRCIGDGACLQACPNGALDRDESGAIQIDRGLCEACGACVDVCPGAALEIFGKNITLDALLPQLEADRVFYETSGGGVTFSGGEPLLQREFLVAALRELHARKISTAVDTTALAPLDTIDEVAEFTDLFLVDLKCMNPEKHKELTGVPLNGILKNLIHICRDLDKPLWVRVPLIPGYTATHENVRGISTFIRNELTQIARLDLLAFSNLAQSKYQALYREWALAGVPLLTLDEAESLAGAAREILPPGIVHLSGPMQVPETHSS